MADVKTQRDNALGLGQDGWASQGDNMLNVPSTANSNATLLAKDKGSVGGGALIAGNMGALAGAGGYSGSISGKATGAKVSDLNVDEESLTKPQDWFKGVSGTAYIGAKAETANQSATMPAVRIQPKEDLNAYEREILAQERAEYENKNMQDADATKEIENKKAEEENAYITQEDYLEKSIELNTDLEVINAFEEKIEQKMKNREEISQEEKDLLEDYLERKPNVESAIASLECNQKWSRGNDLCVPIITQVDSEEDAGLAISINSMEYQALKEVLGGSYEAAMFLADYILDNHGDSFVDNRTAFGIASEAYIHDMLYMRMDSKNTDELSDFERGILEQAEVLHVIFENDDNNGLAEQMAREMSGEHPIRNELIMQAGAEGYIIDSKLHENEDYPIYDWIRNQVF